MDRMGGTSDRLRARARRRTEWLAAAVELLRDDDRVAAAWVFGSEGRGVADELSDLDLFVAFGDSVADAALASLDETAFAAFGDVLWCDDVSGDAPEGMRAFVVGYPAPVEPLTVRWWFQRVGAARLGDDVRVLVDRVGVGAADPPVPTRALLSVPGGGRSSSARPARRIERLQGRVTWFWATAPVVAKWLARGWIDRADDELERMASVVEEASAFLQSDRSERGVEAGLVRPLARLRSAVVELAQLGPDLAAAGLDVPSTDAAYGWLELAEDLEAERWVPNSTKETT